MRDERQLTGKIKAGEKVRLIVDDGNFTDAWEVVSFECFPTNGTGADVQGILSLDEAGLTSGWDASDNRQVGWSFMFIGTNGGAIKSWIRDHIVVRDLWIENFSADPMNYLIRVVRRNISEDQAILALIQERSQDDL